MPPLFEVMRETNPVRTPLTPVSVPIRSRPNSAPVPMPRGSGGAAGQAVPPLTLRTEEDPSPAPEPAAPVDDAAPRSGMGRRWDLNRTVVLPVKTLLFAAGGVMALVVVVWAVAWQLAAQKERQQWAPDPDPTQVTPSAVLPAHDPLAAAERPAAATPLGPSQPANAQPAGAAGGRTPAASADAGAQPPKQASGGSAVIDPRGTGLNYLLVEGVVHYADAEAIVAFLEANGLPAVAIPKGKADIAAAKAAGQKNWEVVLLEGIPGNQYSAMAARRAELIKRVQELGERLGREGLSNYRLASPIWKKY